MDMFCASGDDVSTIKEVLLIYNIVNIIGMVGLSNIEVLTLYFRPCSVESRVRNLTKRNHETMPIPVNRTNNRGKEGMNYRKKEKEILDAVLGASRYDSRIRPAGHRNDTSKLSSIL